MDKSQSGYVNFFILFFAFAVITLLITNVFNLINGFFSVPTSFAQTATPDSDIDGNGKVDIFDYNLLLGDFGKTDSVSLRSDINKNGKVDIFDYNLMLSYFGQTVTRPASGQESYLSDLSWTEVANGWGPVEKDKSVNDQTAGDGNPMVINGVAYQKGFGVNAYSEIKYNMAGSCTGFTAIIGIDDEADGKSWLTNGQSVIFQVFVDNVNVYDSGLMTDTTPAKTINLTNLSGKNELKLVVTDSGNGDAWDHADWADPKITCSVPASYISDLNFTQVTNGWGPIEKNMSNNGDASGDGAPIKINGVTFQKGLGGHANSEVKYNMSGKCSDFSSYVGVDDEVDGQTFNNQSASITFEVYVDGVKSFDSGLMTPTTDAKFVSLTNLSGKNELKLVITDSGNGNVLDHGDWANAKVVCSAFNSTPSPTPTPGTSSTSPSGQAMPVGDLPGWKQIFTEDFNTTASLGQFTNVYGSKWEPYPDGWPNTFGCDGPNVRYMTSKVVSVAGGVLNKYFHSEQMNDPGCGKGFGTYWLSSALQPKVNGVVLNQLYGKYTIRFRSEPLPTYKTAWLLWPQSEVWPRDGEIDFPEGGLDSTICAYMHRQNGVDGGDQDVFCTNTTFTNWHTASIEWHPTQTKFILDGVTIGTSTSRIPNTPMRWVIQSEGCWGGCPPAGASANLQIDWAVIYSKI